MLSSLLLLLDTSLMSLTTKNKTNPIFYSYIHQQLNPQMRLFFLLWSADRLRINSLLRLLILSAHMSPIQSRKSQISKKEYWLLGRNGAVSGGSRVCTVKAWVCSIISWQSMTTGNFPQTCKSAEMQGTTDFFFMFWVNSLYELNYINITSLFFVCARSSAFIFIKRKLWSVEAGRD